MSKLSPFIKDSLIKSIFVMCYIIFMIWVKLFVSTGEIDHFYYIFSDKMVSIYIKLFPFLWGGCFCVLYANDYFKWEKNNKWKNGK